MITIEDLRYQKISIEDLRIGPGFTSVIGPNGSGKTTLLKLLSGIAVPGSGTILIDGKPPRNTEVGWVNEFPDRNILFGSTFEEIASPLRFRDVPCAEIEKRVRRVTESMGIFHLMNQPVMNLSGGEKVLIALAAALVSRPQVLVLDEFDSHLDGNRTAEVARIIRKSGTGYIIHCTQNTEAAARGDAVIFLQEGKVIHAGLPTDVFASLSDTAYYPLSWRCQS